MDPRLLNYYNQELQFVRESGAEFAAEYPKIAGRLGIDVFDCADPYVERLLEGFALLTARIQLKLDAEFPRFTQHLLEMVFPHYLAPQPSMSIVRFQPDLTEGGLAEGFTIPRGTELRSLLGKGEQTRSIFSTAHDVTLWPLELTAASYFPRDVAALNLPEISGVKAALVLNLRATAGLNFSDLSLDTLPLFVQGSSDVPMRIYEQLIANSIGVVVRAGGGDSRWSSPLPGRNVRRLGFDEDQSLLPGGPRSFQGYRLLQEYFAMPQRFMFVELDGLAPLVQTCEDNTLEIAVLLDRGDPLLANRVDESHFSLFASPAINLFPRRADRIHLSDRLSEHHVVPDRTRPMDFEVFQVTAVTGHGTSEDQEQEFSPFYAISDATADQSDRAYYSVTRHPRVLSGKQKKFGPRSSYIGSESFVSLVDATEAPYSHDLRQLSVETLCTNRDLPLQMPVGVGNTDFSMELSAPVESVRCLVGPTKPQPSKCIQRGQTTWRLISHLSLNYLSLADSNGNGGGAAALRELLMLYCDTNDITANKQIDGVRAIETRPVTRPISSTGPLSFGRGLEVTLTLDESSFEGTGAFLLAAVLEEFMAKYVSINSFTETVLQTSQRGEVMRWPARTGRRDLL